MNYLVDFDKRDVIYQHPDKHQLKDYMDYSGLELAYCVISKVEDLVGLLSLEEMQEMYDNITLDQINSDITDETTVANILWNVITEETFPTLNYKTTTKVEAKEPEAETVKTKFRTKDLLDKSFKLGSKTAKEGSVFGVLIAGVDEGDNNFTSLTDYFRFNYTAKNGKEATESNTVGYIRDAVNNGILEIL